MYRAFEKTWRWFGRNDGITLDMLRQIGVEGVVLPVDGGFSSFSGV